MAKAKKKKRQKIYITKPGEKSKSRPRPAKPPQKDTIAKKVNKARKEGPRDASGPLPDILEETFCQNCLVCASPTEAYHRANPRVTRQSASELSHRLLKKVDVRRRIVELLQEAADETIMSKREALRILTEAAKRRKDVEKAVGTSTSKGAETSWTRTTTKPHDPDGEIKLLSKLLGWEGPLEVDLSVKGTLTIEDLIKDADGATRGLPPPRNKPKKKQGKKK